MRVACVIPWMSTFTWAKTLPGFLNLEYPAGTERKWFMSSGWCSARRKTAGVEAALVWEADFVWFVDADQLVEPDTLIRLWEKLRIQDVFAVGAMQPSRGYFPQFAGSKPFQPMCWDEEGRPFTPDVFQPVMYGPLNCFLIYADIFRRLPRPWFSERFDPVTMSRISSLDQHFTKKLWDNGTPLWIDPEVKPRHMEAVPLDWSFQNRFDDLMAKAQ
jgi:hypothetical protein